MNGDLVLDDILEAVQTMKDRLGRAINYSRSRANWANDCWIDASQRQEFWEEAVHEHESWYEDYCRAESLLHRSSGALVRWNGLWRFEPQICFSEVPLQYERITIREDRGVVVEWEQGELLPRIWVIGTGLNPHESIVPDWLSGHTCEAGHLLASGSMDCDELCGLMDETIVREWESVYESIADFERELVLHRARWRKDSTGTEVHEPASFIGDARYRVGRETICLPAAQNAVLESLVELQAGTLADLQRHSGVNNPAATLKAICNSHPSLAPHITLPGGKGKGGYSTTISDARGS